MLLDERFVKGLLVMLFFHVDNNDLKKQEPLLFSFFEQLLDEEDGSWDDGVYANDMLIEHSVISSQII